MKSRSIFLLRAGLAFTHDVVACALAWAAAFWLRFNLDVPPPYYSRLFVQTVPWVVLVHALAFLGLGLYRGVWRYASLPDLQRILAAVGVGALAMPALFTLYGFEYGVPRAVYLMSPILLAAAMAGDRLLYRAWKEGRLLGVVRHPDAQPVLVLGGGEAAAALLKGLENSREWRVLGLLDDNAARHGAAIHGVKVLGALEQVGEVAERLGVVQAIIALPGASHSARRRALELCSAAGLKVMTVPAYADIVSGRVSVSALRQIELEDLLGRDPVVLDEQGLKGLLNERIVLVTGAGGSIGSELCRQIARYAPRQLVLFERSEFALYTIAQEFADRHPDVPAVPVIGDAKDAGRVREVFARYRPAVVFHAAAYKHVPLMEDENAFEAVANNVLSTYHVACAALEAGARKFVLVSTDKAVNPTNVMGASKRLAEIICQSLQRQAGTECVVVRFGNVLGSAGSVIPRFREQLARGGPLTVTHPEIERFFMTIPEAVQLVLQSAAMGRGGEIYVLDMGEPVRIVDLARQLVRLSGFSERDIEIVFTGLRPGEKLYEEVLADAEHTLATPHPKLRIALAREVATPLSQVIEWLEHGPAEAQTVRAQLQAWIPEYRPAGRELHHRAREASAR